MTIEFRAITESEFDPVYEFFMGVFGTPTSDEDRENVRRWLELDRTFAAFDDGAVVATTAAVSLPILVPGGASVPTAAVTIVTTAPTHRRTGLMRAGMEVLYDQAREREEPLATLWASESSIYGHVGFGSAIDAAEARIPRHQSALRADAPVGHGRVRMVDPEKARDSIIRAYGDAIADVPGAMVRRERDWDLVFADPEHSRHGRARTRFALYEEDGTPRGYVRYRVVEKWTDLNPDNTVEVIELHAVDVIAYAELWRFVTSIDLVETIKVKLVRPRSRLATLLADPRRLRLSVGESIWVGFVDLPVALSARRYAVEGDLVVAIDDPLGYATGRYRLIGGPDGATVESTDAEPDVALSSGALGSAYLGAPRLRDLAWAGRVHGDPESIGLIDAMFGWHDQPSCTVHF